MGELKKVITPHINPKDCWNLVLARVSGEDYHDIREKMFKNSYADENGLHGHLTNKVLMQYGFGGVHLGALPIKEPSVRDILIAFYNYEIVIGSFDNESMLYHLSYAYKGIEYTTLESELSYENKVYFVWIRYPSQFIGRINYN